MLGCFANVGLVVAAFYGNGGMTRVNMAFEILGAYIVVKLELVGDPTEPDHHPCQKPEKAMGWNQCEKVLALLSTAL